MQWHPEKNIFEWTTAESINHSYHAVSIAQTAANFFVSEARKSEHHFTSEEEEMDTLIYNYQPTYTGKTSHSFEQEFCISPLSINYDIVAAAVVYFVVVCCLFLLEFESENNKKLKGRRERESVE